MARPLAAAQLASIQRFGFRTRQVETVVLVGVTPTLLANNDPDRISLLLILEGTFQTNVGRNGAVTIASGVPIVAQWDSLLFEMDIDGEATGYERWAIANGGAANVRVIETKRLANA